jgi:DNA-binding NtrC family response regulator
MRLFNKIQKAQAKPIKVSINKIKEKMNKDLQEIIMLYLLTNIYEENIQLKDFLKGFEKNIIINVLKITGGSQKMSAEILGVKPSTFFEKLKKYNIKQGVRTYKKREN